MSPFGPTRAEQDRAGAELMRNVADVFGWPGCVSPEETIEAARAEKALADAARCAGLAGEHAPQLRVFHEGDPEPGPEVAAVLDGGDVVWWRKDDEWVDFAGSWSWQAMVSRYGPVVACGPLPDYQAAVETDDQQRAAAHFAGGAQ